MKFRLSIAILLFVSVTFAQTSLPIFRTNWTTETSSAWTDWGTGSYTLPFSCSGDSSGKLQNEGDYYEINFSETAEQVSFQLKGDSFKKGEFAIQESEDGVYWTNISVYNELQNECQQESFSLSNRSRYIRFYYLLKAKGNILIDDVYITEKKTTELAQN